MRTLLAILLTALVQPVNAQPITNGDEVRVREAKGAPWTTGTYAGSDSINFVLMQNGVERAHEILALQRIEWKAPRNLPLEMLLGVAAGAAVGLGIELFSLLTSSSCWDWSSNTECNEDWGKAAGIGAVAGAGWILISYAIWPRDWKNVTKHYPPAGGSQ